MSHPKILEPLAQEARKAGSWDNFKYDYTIQIKRGLYWHITENESFEVDPDSGPRDYSSMASGGLSPGALMVTSHLDWWVSHYNYKGAILPRRFAAQIDLSRVPRGNYSQVSRGFGNEFYVPDSSQARVVRVLPIQKAKAFDRYYDSMLPRSEEELKKFYDEVVSDETTSNSTMEFLGVVLQELYF